MFIPPEIALTIDRSNDVVLLCFCVYRCLCYYNAHRASTTTTVVGLFIRFAMRVIVAFAPFGARHSPGAKRACVY